MIITGKQKFKIKLETLRCQYAQFVVDYIEKNGLDDFIQIVNCSKKDIEAMIRLKHNYTLTQMITIANINGHSFS